jgi:hypothetical protein
VTFSLPEFKIKKNLRSFWAFHVDERSESSRTYDMIIDQGGNIFQVLGIIMKFNEQTVTCNNDTIPINDRDTALYHQ